jgi:hypothetical protein
VLAHHGEVGRAAVVRLQALGELPGRLPAGPLAQALEPAFQLGVLLGLRADQLARSLDAPLGERTDQLGAVEDVQQVERPDVVREG